MRIAVDMDEVLADTLGAKRAIFRERFGYTWSDADLAGCRPQDLAAPDHAAAVEEILQEGTIFGELDPMPGAQEAMERLVARHEVFVASAAMEYPASVGPKVDWLARHFPMVPRLNTVLMGHKFILAVDGLIDDSLRHFARISGRGILFDAPHNAGVPWPDRLHGWTGDAVERIEEMLGQ